ncbi:MAG: hypothetical protein MUP69_09945, partial [Candidatus Atribacteria bacterium]|nr:hypothetical protein [Candidatus Atribacteria bacterium]
ITGLNSGSGSGTLTVTYVDLNHDVCGDAEFEIVATIGVTVDAGLTGAEFADTYAFTICSEQTLDIGSLVTIVPEFGGVPGTPVTLTELIALGGYVVETSDGSFSLSGTEISGTSSGAGSGTLTVSYVDPTPDDCGAAEFTIVGTIGVIVDEDQFFIVDNKGGHYGLDITDPDPDPITVAHNANHIYFGLSLCSDPSATIEYMYDRTHCGGSPSDWILIAPGEIDSEDILLCENDDTILNIRIDGGLPYTFIIWRPSQN